MIGKRKLSLFLTIVVFISFCFGFINAEETQPENNDLPAPWASTDLFSRADYIGKPGSAVYKDGEFTIKSCGREAWGDIQAFHYMYQTVKGDVDMTARVTRVDNTHDYAVAGIMFRQELKGISPNAVVDVRPVDIPTYWVTRRRVHGGAYLGKTTQPDWIRLVRRGHTFWAYVSEDGQKWHLIEEMYFDLPDTIYVGLYVCSKNMTKYNTGVFDNVTIKKLQPRKDNPSPTEKYVYNFDRKLIKYTGKKWTENDWGHHETTNNGDSAEFSFEGTSVKMLGVKKPWSSSLDIFLDGKLEETVSQKKNPEDNNCINFERVGLKKGTHTIKLVCRGNGYVYLDSIIYDTREYTGKTVKVKVPQFKVLAGGVEINNLKVHNPVIMYNGVPYFPLTKEYCDAMGVEAVLDEKAGLNVKINSEMNKAMPLQDTISGSNPNTEYIATLPSYNIAVNGKKIDNSKEKNPVIVFRDTVYFPLSDRFAKNEFNWKYTFDVKKGLDLKK